MPETDLSTLYEENDIPEEKAAYITYIEKKFRRKMVNTWEDWTGDEPFYWLRVEGGYKLYDDADAQDRWYFRLGIERPTAMITENEIQYFWLTYEDEDLSDEFSGAVGCKITTGSPLKTEVHQWEGVTNLAKGSKLVKDKLWKNQGKETRMTHPEYFATFWNEENYSV